MQYAVIRRNLKDVSLAGLITFAIVITLPLLATIAVVVRPIVALGIAIVILMAFIACGLSDRFRLWLEEHDSAEVGYRGLHYLTDVRFSRSHCWVRDGESVTIGVDDLVQASIGPVSDVDLPAVGLRIKQGEPLFRLHSRGRRLEMRSPVTGTVVAANALLLKQPGLVNEQPYSGGWIVRLNPEQKRAEWGRLLQGRFARTWFKREVDLFCCALPKRFDATADACSTTSVPVGSVHLWIDDSSWRRLADEMFSGTSRGDAIAR